MSLYTICTDTTCPNYNTRYGSLGTTTHVECGGCQELLEVQDDGVEEILNIQNDAETLVRAARDRQLAESDFRMVSDAPWDTEAWATYRQALRDLPADPAWPDVEFPCPRS